MRSRTLTSQSPGPVLGPMPQGNFSVPRLVGFAGRVSATLICSFMQALLTLNVKSKDAGSFSTAATDRTDGQTRSPSGVLYQSSKVLLNMVIVSGLWGSMSAGISLPLSLTVFVQ